MIDTRQDIFHTFEVPDPIRIKKVARFLRQYFPSLKGRRLLECGYAKGGLADVLRDDGMIATCVDINPRVAEKDVHIVHRDLNDGFPPFEEKFDIIFAGEVMEHLFDDRKFLQEARAALKPDSVLALTVPNLAFSVNRLRALFGLTPLFAYAPYHYHFYTEKTLRDLLEGERFEIVKLISSHVLFSTRRSPIGKVFEILGDHFPSWGAHLIVVAKPRNR